MESQAPCYARLTTRARERSSPAAADRFAGAEAAVRGGGAGWYLQEREYAEGMAALAESHVNVGGGLILGFILGLDC
jgi:hypothetical protein